MTDHCGARTTVKSPVTINRPGAGGAYLCRPCSGAAVRASRSYTRQRVAHPFTAQHGLVRVCSPLFCVFHHRQSTWCGTIMYHFSVYHFSMYHFSVYVTTWSSDKVDKTIEMVVKSVERLYGLLSRIPQLPSPHRYAQ